jgi:hypothetical protein
MLLHSLLDSLVFIAGIISAFAIAASLATRHFRFAARVILISLGGIGLFVLAHIF